MIGRLAAQVALAVTAIFFGIALYITLGEQLSRLVLADGPMLDQWKVSFRIAFLLQSTFTVVAGVAGLVSYWQIRRWPWLVAGLLMLANWPWTLVMIQPINSALLAAQAGTPETRVLIEQWGLVHTGRTLFSGLALCLLLWVGTAGSGDRDWGARKQV